MPRRGVEAMFGLMISPSPSTFTPTVVHEPVDMQHVTVSTNASTERLNVESNLDHLCPPDEFKKISIIREWEGEMSTESLRMVVCAVCSKRVSQSESNWVNGDSIDLTLLRNSLLPERILPRTYDRVQYKNAILNPKGLEFTDKVGHIRICGKCYTSLRSSAMPKFALSNWLYYGHESLPAVIKADFEQATLFDKKLICRARANSITCRFNSGGGEELEHSNGNLLSRARKGIRGNVMVAPLDVIKMNRIVPPVSDSIRDTMCAVFVGDKLPNRSTIRKYSPVLVRKSRVKRMILFLLRYNRHYKPSSEFNFSEDNLNSLFDGEFDEGVPSSVHLGFIPNNDAIDASVSDYTSRNVDTDNNDEHVDELLMENVGYTLGDDSPLSYETMKNLALERCLQGKPFIVSGKGPTAVPDFHNPFILTWLFPHLDPWGIGGFYHPGRLVKISMEEQLRHLLLIDDSPFEKDSEFAFVFYNICRKSLISQSLRFSVSQRVHRQVVENLLKIDPEILAKLNQDCEKDFQYKPTDEQEIRIFKLLGSLRLIAKHVPGSDGYKTMLRNEIRALINYRGAPTLFITLNPSDVDHPIVRLLAGENIQLEDISRGEDMTEWKRKLFAARNPSACAKFFDLVISKFIKIVLRHGSDSAGLYGKCSAYYGTVEAQGKGTLHCHMLIWLKGHPSPQELRNHMAGSDEYTEKVFQWLESVIKCEFPAAPTPEIQILNYPRRILHNERGEPHPGVIPIPSANVHDNELPNFWKEFNESLSRLLYQYSWHEHQATCWKYLRRGQERIDQNCRMGMDGEIQEVTRLDETSQSIILRRHHPRIAPYTDVVTYLLQCNMDIKFVGSGEAAKAFLYYVTDYITKPSLSVHAGMAALSYVVKKVHSRIPEGLNGCSNSQATGAVISAVNGMMGRLEISHPQVMSYLVGGGDHYTSDKFSVLQWNAFRKFGQSEVMESSGRDASEPQSAENTVALAFASKSITVSNQQLDYVYRGQHPTYSSLCLYDFVALTSKSRYGKNVDIETGIPGSFISSQHPQRYTHHLVLRRERHIPVILGPSIPNPNKSTEVREEWARDMLLLFKPWRNLSDLRDQNESWTDAFRRYETDLSEKHRNIIANMQVLTECSEARDNHRQGRRIRERNDLILEESDAACLQDSEGREHSVNFAEIYHYDPFRELDDTLGEGQNDVSDSYGILSGESSRLLDMCLPVNMEDLVDPARESIKLPSQVLECDREELAFQMAVMTRKRKRLHNVEDEDEENDDRESSVRRRIQTEIPIVIRTVLQDGTGNRSNRVKAVRVADQIILEMGLQNNQEQLRAFNLIARHLIERKEEQLLMHVAGVGGTGKSHVIRSIVLLFERLDKRRELLLGAPTGIAAVLIRGQTLHSLILMTPNSKSKNIAPLSRIWKHVKFLIIDEVSMVGARFLSQLSSRIRQARGDDIINHGKPFGGVNVIFMGDFAQLKPPKQYALYSNELVKNPSFAESRNEKGISAMNGAFLWRQVNAVIELVKNQRQSDDPVYAEFLQRLRLGQCRNEAVPPLNISDSAYLRSRLMENQASNPLVLEAFKDAPIIVGSKSLRDILNVKLVKYHSKRTGSELHIYYSKDSFNKKLASGHVQKRLWDLPSAVNREAFGRLPLFVGMKVMVTENLAFDDGIVNGSEGVIMDIKFDEDSKGRRYATVVYVRIPGCGIRVDGLAHDVVPIFPVATRIEHKPLTLTEVKSKSFTRKQLPLVPAYVFTDFKSQGRTLERAIVDLATARGQGVYVMLSRVKSLSGLLILRWFPPTKIYRRLPEELRDELARLYGLSLASL